MRVLIPSHPGDVHATVVQRALTAIGDDAVITCGADLPTAETLSVTIEHGRASLLELGAVEPGFGTVWVRRPTPPRLPAGLDPEDHAFAEREWRHALDATWNVIEPDAFFVNRRARSHQASCKATQLVTAARVGWTVPRTLISSDPARIRAFLREQAGETIYKPFGQAHWSMPEGRALLYTSVVGADDLPDDEVLRLCPGLFQPRVPKAYELRITVMGHHVFASRIDSQRVEHARVDWRAANDVVDVQPHALAPAVADRCRALTDALGLVFGCIDAIVTPAGDVVFLELNPMGQFLWIEQVNPEHPLLDAFCALLHHGRPDFPWDPRRASLRFADFYDAASDDPVAAAHHPC